MQTVTPSLWAPTRDRHVGEEFEELLQMCEQSCKKLLIRVVTSLIVPLRISWRGMIWYILKVMGEALAPKVGIGDGSGGQGDQLYKMLDKSSMKIA